LPDICESDISLSLLSELPILSKKDIARQFEDLRASHGLPAYTMFTSGTTGPREIIFGTQADIDFIHESSEVDCSRHRKGRRALFPLRLTMTGFSQGNVPLVPGRMGFIAVPLQGANTYRSLWALLNESFSFVGFKPRVSQLLLSTPALKKLTHFVLENDLDTQNLALDSVIGFSFHASTRWRERIEEVLGAPMSDVYGCSEIPPGRAVRAPGEKYFYFDEAVICEVVDLKTEKPITSGIGKILLTSLYPFNQYLPLFRYELGDVVEVGPIDLRHGEWGVRPRGRLHHTIVLPHRHGPLFPLFPIDVQELIDMHPWVGRLSESYAHATKTSDDGFPKWRIVELECRAGSRRDVRLEIEMKSAPYLFADDWDHFSAGLLAALKEINPMLEAALKNGLLDFSIRGLAPGSLADQDVFVY
jgi:phenylacetate-coenzyme A ligase PaaK-like adenylate-forming protein